MLPPPVPQYSSLRIPLKKLPISLETLTIPKAHKPISDLELRIYAWADSHNISREGYHGFLEILHSLGLDPGYTGSILMIPTDIGSLKKHLRGQINMLPIQHRKSRKQCLWPTWKP